MKFLSSLPTLRIRTKIIILCIVVSLAPLILIASFTFVYLSKVVENKISDTTSNLLGSINWNIQTFINDVEGISKLILSSRDIQSFLTYKKDNFKEEYRLQTATRDLMINISNNKSYIRYVYVGSETNELITTNKWDGVGLEHFYNDVSRTDWYKTVDAQKGKGVWLNNDDIRLTRSSNLLLYGKRLNNLDTLEPIGMLIISIDEHVFDEMFRDIKKTQNGNFVILAQNKIVYANSQTVDISSIPLQDMEMIHNLPDKGTRIQMLKGEKYIVTFDTNPGTKWKVISMIPYSSVNGEIVFIRNLTITLSALTFLLAAYGSFLISNKITKQLTLLTSIARKVAKRDEIDGIHFKDNDEIGKIGNQFLEIFRTNTELTDKLYEAKLKEKEAELHALQSNINPHFLYNTLNSIFLMAEKIGAKNISKMVMSLSNIFKLSLNNGQYITTVANEMEQVRNYLEIQNIRYRGKFDVAIEIEPSILNLRMLKLLIQPIVENAIYHGMELKEEKGFISIIGRREDKALVFEVKDDGVGFDPETAKEGYALQNIRERIALQYGSEYAMRVESKPGAGTKVTLIIGIME